MNQVIELRQASADTINNNGDFIVNLPYNKRLTISEGDVVQVKNTFIDTEASTSQKINLIDEIKVDFTFAKYYIWNRLEMLNQVDDTPLPSPLFPDFDYYFLCSNVGGNPNLYQVLLLKDIHFGGETSIITAQFTDEKGNPQVKKYPTTQKNGVEYEAVCNFIYDKTKPLTLTSNAQGAQVSVETEKQVSGVHLVPELDTISIKIESGNYTPADLANVINEKLSVGGTSGGLNQIGASKFLGKYNELFLVKWDGSNAYKIKTLGGGANQTTNSLLLGASQIEFDYIQDTSQFSINYSYTPYYAGGDQQTGKPYQPSVGYVAQEFQVGTFRTYTINKNSGVVFTDIVSQYINKTSEEIDFFKDILGFTQSNLLTFGTRSNITIGAITFNSLPITAGQPQDGVLTSGAYIGLDTYINKLSDTWFSPANDQQTSLLSVSTNSTPILGTQKTLANVPYGYYLVEIKTNYSTQFFSKENNLDIGAIVSRYYETDSYTSGSSLDSVPYIHKGSPINLNSFRVRILTPDKQLVNNLGDGSAVYLQITKTE